MAKVNIKSEKITPFGGIYYASKAFYALSLDKVINGTLGVRSSTYNGYQWDEIMSAMSDVFLCGGDCVEDVNRSECHLRESPEVRIPTSHTIGRAIRELSHEDMEYKSSSGNVFRFNTTPRLNDLLMKLNMKMGMFKSGQIVNVDFGHVFVKTLSANLRMQRRFEEDVIIFARGKLISYVHASISLQGWVCSTHPPSNPRLDGQRRYITLQSKLASSTVQPWVGR